MKFIMVTVWRQKWEPETAKAVEISFSAAINVSCITAIYADDATGDGKIKTRIDFDADNYMNVNETPDRVMELINNA